MRILAILKPTPTATLESISAVLPREEIALWRSIAEGACRGAFYNEAQFGSVVLDMEAADAAAAKALIQALPLVAEGLMQVEYLPLRPYTGLSLMFRSELGFQPTPPAAWFAQR